MGKKKKQRIRALALCVFRRDDKIFVSEGYDPSLNKRFFRPIGGGIEFGERAVDTIHREVMEEIGTEVTDLVYLGTLENIFVYDGNKGHEICLIFDGCFVDAARDADDYTVVGDDAGEILYTAMWKPIAYFRAVGAPPLYPDGLLNLLDE